MAIAVLGLIAACAPREPKEAVDARPPDWASEIGSPEAAALVRRLESEDLTDQLDALRGLKALGSEGHRALLIAAGCDDDSLAGAALSGVVSLGPEDEEAVPVLASYLGDARHGVTAWMGLLAIGSPAVVRELDAALGSRDDLKSWTCVVFVLSSLEDPGVPPILERELWKHRSDFFRTMYLLSKASAGTYCDLANQWRRDLRNDPAVPEMHKSLLRGEADCARHRDGGPSGADAPRDG